jgi:hypothetical protein
VEDVLLLQLSTWGPAVGRVRASFCFGISNVQAGSVDEEAKVITQVVLPWRIPIVILLSFCLSCFLASNFECRVAMDGRGRRLQCWSIDAPEYLDMWSGRSRWFDDFGAEAWSFVNGMGERGFNSFFVKFEKFIYFEPRKFNLWLASSILPAFLPSAFHRPWHWGLILNAWFPGRFFMSNDGISPQAYARNLNYNGTFLFLHASHALYQLATWSSFEMLFLFLQILTRS